MANNLNAADLPAQQQLTIYAYSDSSFRSQVGQELKLMLNPNKFKHQHSIEYTSTQLQPFGLPDVSKMYRSTNAEKLSFTLLFEGTGAVKGQSTSDVKQQVNDFYNLCYAVNGNIHRPNFIKLVWGNIEFRGQLVSCDINYLLFKPNGVPLRAEVEVLFEQYKDPVQLKNELNLSSPDMTHKREIKEGDTLPLLCREIYGDDSYYVQVAQVNKLPGFRRLVPGSKIFFPPLQL